MSLHDLVVLADALKSKRARFGWPETEHYPESGTPVALVAMVQEFGSHDTPFPIPARPFIRPGIAANKQDAIQIAVDDIKGLLYGIGTVEGLFDDLGQSYAGRIKEAISDVREPALSHATLVLRKWKDQDQNFKGSIEMVLRAQQSTTDLGGVPTKPLVDSGLLIATVTSRVDDA